MSLSIRTNILLRVYLAFGVILLFAGAVAVQLCRLQFVQGKQWKAMSTKYVTHYEPVEAARGNILSVDGSLLATSVPEYDLHLRMRGKGLADDKLFFEKVDSLALKLSQLYPDKSEREFSRILRNGRATHAPYLSVRNNVTYTELQQLLKFPLFNKGKYISGLQIEQKNKRILPFHSLAARTIGYKNENVKNPVGLEGAYASYIAGENGKRLMQRTPGGGLVPVNDDGDDVPAVDGSDIISTIDVNFQDVAQTALLKQLRKSKADYGCVILMETATGEIRAIANFTKVKSADTSDYKEKLNYAISNAIDPGSTFKLATYMALFDQHKIDTNSIINTEWGKYKVLKGPTISDVEHDKTTMTAKTAFEQSSNVAAARFVLNSYGNNPKEYTDALYSYHLNEKLVLQISGETAPLIKNPGSRTWNKYYTLPEMAYGYEMNITPLQMLTFYNSVANDGRMIAPIFVREIQKMGNTVQQFHAREINPKVCSDATLGKMKALLEGVVTEGTAKTLFKNSRYAIAGKTGTAQMANKSEGYGVNKVYQGSFCGYFPADHPKYSMIVVINHPQGLYLAAQVAGPVFKEIADRVYASDLNINHAPPAYLIGNTTLPVVKQGNVAAVRKVYSKLGIKPFYASNTGGGIDTTNGIANEERENKTGTVPSVLNMGLSDALYVLGNAGYKVVVRGSGAVTRQSVTGGSYIPRGSKITIELQ